MRKSTVSIALSLVLILSSFSGAFAEDEIVALSDEAVEVVEEQDEEAAVEETFFEDEIVEEAESLIGEEAAYDELIEGIEEEILPVEEDGEEDVEDEVESADGWEDVLVGDGEVVAEGDCGEYGHETEVKWKLTGSGSDLTLTISGSGSMRNFSKNTIPWASKRAQIKTVSVENGVTRVGDYSFYSLNNLNGISLPDGLLTIGQFSFAQDRKIENIRIPSSVTVMEKGAFSNSGIKEFEIPSGVVMISDSIFFWMQKSYKYHHSE